jgi:ATP-dependent Clp protease ATP-binding subunit ClpA
MGARPMARIIREHIRRPLAEELLFGKLTGGGHVTVRVGEDDDLELVAQSLIESETVD